MPVEVEQKYRVTDSPALERSLEQLAGSVSAAELQVDCYYAHPARDFAATDEALRIRRIGPRNFLTYKGPKLDATTKTRREIEAPLESGEQGAERFAELLGALGFRPVAEVRKQRRHVEIDWQGYRVTAALDKVSQVGSFVELELVVEPPNMEAAKQCLASLAERLGLSGSERRSYLELLLEATRR